MKLIWHIIKKDIVRDRWAIGLWALLFAAEVGVGLALLAESAPDKDWIQQLQLASAVLVFIQMAMAFILVGRLVLADVVMATDQFWVTRPISRARLFLAKALGALLVFGLLPVFLLLPWWLWCHFEARDILWAAVETFGWQLLVIAPAFLVASLTNEISRLLLWTLLLFVGLLMWISLVAASLRSVTMPGEAGLFMTRLWLSVLLFVIGSGGIAAYAFLTRSFVRSVTWVVFGLGLVALVGWSWPLDWSTGIAGLSRRSPAPVPAGLVEGITLTPAGMSVTLGKPRKGQEQPFNLLFAVQGLPVGMSLVTGYTTHTWRWPGGLVFHREGRFGGTRYPGEVILRNALSLPTPPEDPETAAWYQQKREEVRAKEFARGLVPTEGWKPDKDSQRMSLYTTLPESVVAKIRADAPAYAAQIEAVLQRPEIAYGIPFRAGTAAAGDSRTIRLHHVMRHAADEERRVAVLVTTRPSVQAAGAWLAGIWRQDLGWFRQDTFFLVNRSTGDIRRPSRGTLSSEILIGGVFLMWNDLGVSPATVIRNGKGVPADPQWLEHSELFLLTDQEVARFTPEVKMTRLPVIHEGTSWTK